MRWSPRIPYGDHEGCEATYVGRLPPLPALVTPPIESLLFEEVGLGVLFMFGVLLTAGLD
jgi:hypothetical protein